MADVPPVTPANTGFVSYRPSGGAPVTGAAARLTATVDNQSVSFQAGQTVSVSLPASTFVSSDPGARIQVQAVQANGRPLPGWLRFNPVTGTFEGTPPPDFTGELNLRVIARDQNGHSAAVEVKLKFARPAVQGAMDHSVILVDGREPLQATRPGLGHPPAHRADAGGRPSLGQQMQRLGRGDGQRERMDLIAQIRSLARPPRA